MREQVQELFQSRTRRSSPNYRDWQTFLDLITYSYILNRDAPIYTLYRGAINLRNFIGSGQSTLTDISTLAQDRLKVETDVNTNALTAASRNLNLYGTTMEDRGITSTDSVSGLAIFNDQLDKALDTMKDGVGNETSPDEARSQIVEDLATFREFEEELSALTALLESGLDTYMGISLRGSGLAAIAERGVRIIDAINDEAGLDTLALKAGIEQLIAIKSSVNALSQIGEPVLEILEGTGQAAGTGTSAEITTAASGPWDFETGVSDGLDIEIDGAGAVNLTMPGATKAFARTKDATLVGTPPSGFGWALGCTTAAAVPWVPVTIKVDGVYVVVSTPLALHYLGAVFPQVPYVDIQDLQAILTGVGASLNVSLVAPDPFTKYLTVERAVPGTNKSFNISANVFAVTSGFCNVMGDIGFNDSGDETTNYVDNTYRGESVSVEDTLAAVTSGTNLLKTTRTYEELLTGAYGIIPVSNVLVVLKINDTTGGLFTTQGDVVVTSTTYNFIGQGVEPGDIIKFDGNNYTVRFVSESSVTLETPSTSATGSYNFQVYPDTSVISAGDYVEVRDITGLFTEKLYILSVAESVITLINRAFRIGVTVEFTVVRDYLTLGSTKTDTTSSLRVVAPSTGNIYTGFPTTEVRGGVYSYEDTTLSFSDYNILLADILRTGGTDYVITSIGEDLGLTVQLPSNESGAYTVINPDRESYDAFVQSLTAWRALHLDYYDELDKKLNIILNDDPRQDAITALQTYILGILAAYDQLLGYIAAFSARRILDIDNVFKILLEGGFDRARDLLLSGDFVKFFALEAEEATYEGYFQLETQEFVRTYASPSKYDEPSEVELDEYILPGIESTQFGE